MVKNKIAAIDTHDPDTVHALRYLLELAEAGSVTGMVFALSLKDRKYPHLCGVTGRLAKNQNEAAGVSGMLNLKLTQEALDAATQQT